MRSPRKVRFESAETVVRARAPGRLDVLGGFADYSGATVLELPLARAAEVRLGVRPDRRVSLATARAEDVQPQVHVEESVDALIEAMREERTRVPRWCRYVAGVLAVWDRLGFGVRDRAVGFDLVVASDIPWGAGLASSAAVEVAGAQVLANHFGVRRTSRELALDCQRAENEIVGAPCGAMDQLTVVFGERDRLSVIDCAVPAVRGALEVPAGMRFFGLVSRAEHALAAGTAYRDVRCAAFMGQRLLADRLGLDARAPACFPLVRVPRSSAAALRDELPGRMAGAEFLTSFSGTLDEVTAVETEGTYPVRAATLHAIEEHARVLRAVDLLESASPSEALEQADEFGALMAASHASYGACGLGSDATDRIVAEVLEAGAVHGLFGAKITGGGSGGTVAVLARDDRVARSALAEIGARCGAELVEGSSEGAALSGVSTRPAAEGEES